MKMKASAMFPEVKMLVLRDVKGSYKKKKK